MAENSVALLECEQGDAAFRKLMSSPVNAPRKRIRRVKVEVEESVSTTGKSLADIYTKRKLVSLLSKPCPTYLQWLRSLVSPADADREGARAKAEWADRRAGLFSRAVLRRRKQIASGMLQALPVAVIIPEPLPERKPSKRTSRSSWPSFRARQIAGLVATGEWEYLADIGLRSIHPGNQLRIGLRCAEVIPLPIVEYVEEITIEAPEYAEAA